MVPLEDGAGSLQVGDLREASLELGKGVGHGVLGGRDGGNLDDRGGRLGRERHTPDPDGPIGRSEHLGVPGGVTVRPQLSLVEAVLHEPCP